MQTTFQSNLRTKSSEQLLNMAANKTSWSNEQFKQILFEINNRGISNLEIDELNEEAEVADLGEAFQSDFEKDLDVIYQAEEKETHGNRYQVFALSVNMVLTFFMAFTIFGGFSLVGIDSEFTDVYFYVFLEYLLYIIVWFFTVWGLFIAKKYLLSMIASGGLGIFIIIMTMINY